MQIGTFLHEETIVLVPLGATEQHGPHLPVGTDALISQSLAEQVCKHSTCQANVLIAPTMFVGVSPEHTSFSGTLSMSLETSIAWITEVVGQIIDQGFKKIVFLNCHGGQVGLIDQIAFSLRAKKDFLGIRFHLPKIGYPQGVFDDEERVFGVHGGEIETSIMQFLYPNLVDKEMIEQFPLLQNNLAHRRRSFGFGTGVGLAWKMADVQEFGACGKIANATAKKGEAYVRYILQRLEFVMHDACSFQLKNFAFAPGSTQPILSSAIKEAFEGNTQEQDSLVKEKGDQAKTPPIKPRKAEKVRIQKTPVTVAARDNQFERTDPIVSLDQDSAEIVAKQMAFERSGEVLTKVESGTTKDEREYKKGMMSITQVFANLLSGRKDK